METGTGTQPRENTDNAKQLFEITTSTTAAAARDTNYYYYHNRYHNEYVLKANSLNDLYRYLAHIHF